MKTSGKGDEDVLTEYAEFIDIGTVNYLIDLISKTERKPKTEVLKELGINREALYGPNGKSRVLSEAVKRLDKLTVIKILYGKMKNVYINFVIDILSVSADELDSDGFAEFVKILIDENSGLIKTVNDVERKKIIEIVREKLNKSYRRTVP